MESMQADFVPDGKNWVIVNGLYHNDMYEVDESSPEAEVAEARARYRADYPTKCVIIEVIRVEKKGNTNVARP